MIKIIFKKSFIFILFTISSLIYAEDSVKLKNIPPTSSENEVFNENIPAQISEANAEFIYKFLPLTDHLLLFRNYFQFYSFVFLRLLRNRFLPLLLAQWLKSVLVS